MRLLLGLLAPLFAPPLVAGTTICAVRYADGVVIGADSRSTGGGVVVGRDTAKVRRVAPAAALAGAGVSAECARVARSLGQETALQRLRDELGGETSQLSAAFLVRSLRRLVQRLTDGNSVFLLGAVSGGEPALFLVHGSGAEEAVSLGAFGSG